MNEVTRIAVGHKYLVVRSCLTFFVVANLLLASAKGRCGNHIHLFPHKFIAATVYEIAASLRSSQ